MAYQPWMPEGVRGAKALRGTIQGAVRAGLSLDQLLSSVQSLYAQQNATLRSQTVGAISNLYSQMADLESKARALRHVAGNIGLSSRWISFAQLERPLSNWSLNPKISVRIRAEGRVAGQVVSRWLTMNYEGYSMRGLTIGDLRYRAQVFLESEDYPELAGQTDLTYTDLAITAY